MPHGVERTRQRCTLRTSGQARVLGPRRGIGASDSVVGIMIFFHKLFILEEWCLLVMDGLLRRKISCYSTAMHI